MEENPLPPDDEDLVDQLREMPVGMNDPNIIGDAGATDVPPGSDPPVAPREPVADEIPPEGEEPTGLA